MKRESKLKNAEDYDALVEKELEHFKPLALELAVDVDVLREAARLGVRDGIYRHRETTACKYREEECVMWSIRHFVQITLVRACLLAATEEDMEIAESVLMRLIED